MANEATSNGAQFDPMNSFRQMRDAYLDVWAKTMVDTVNTEAYAKATGNMLDTYLAMSSPFREAVEKGLLQALQQLNLPSRVDFMGLAERLTNEAMRLDDMTAHWNRIKAPFLNPRPVPRRRAPAAATAAKRSRRASRRKGKK